MKTYKICIFLSLVFSVCISLAQQHTKIGLTSGISRFYPETKFFSQSLNNLAKNGIDWSVGLYYEKKWKPKINPCLELNYNNSTSSFYLETSSINSTTGEHQQSESANFSNVPFRYFALSMGSKIFFNSKLFIAPGLEFAKSLNRRVDLWSIVYYSKDWNMVYLKDRYLSKTNYNVILGIGVDLKAIDLIIEYKYSLNYQLSFFEYSKPFGINHRNKYLQLKVQVPLFNF